MINSLEKTRSVLFFSVRRTLFLVPLAWAGDSQGAPEDAPGFFADEWRVTAAFYGVFFAFLLLTSLSETEGPGWQIELQVLATVVATIGIVLFVVGAEGAIRIAWKVVSLLVVVWYVLVPPLEAFLPRRNAPSFPEPAWWRRLGTVCVYMFVTAPAALINIAFAYDVKGFIGRGGP